LFPFGSFGVEDCVGTASGWLEGAAEVTADAGGAASAGFAASSGAGAGAGGFRHEIDTAQPSEQMKAAMRIE